jgi:hypothetical protein
MDSRLISEMVKKERVEKMQKKRIECALAEFEVQRDIEKGQAADRKARELQWILYGGKYPE